MTIKINRREAAKLLFSTVAALSVTGCGAGDYVTRLAMKQTPTALVQAKDYPYVTLYAQKGPAYKTIVKHSHYNAPIVENGQLRGKSRIWGDASHKTQRASIEAIRAAAKHVGMTREQEAMVLAIAYVESGFNPDAAAGTTSAQGLGQFIRKTGASYGLTDANRWDIREQARALVEHTLDNYAAARKAGLGGEYVYARHHDGSFTNKYGGVDIARNHVLPFASIVLYVLQER